MVVLGVALGSDGAAALAWDGCVRAAALDAQVCRRDAGRVPSGAIDAVLERAGARVRDVVDIVASLPPSVGRLEGMAALLDLRRHLARCGARVRPSLRQGLWASAPGQRPTSVLPGGVGRAVAAALTPRDAGAGVPSDAGPTFTAIDAFRQLGVLGLPRHEAVDLPERVAGILARGGRVAWAQGGCEPTPWTLGRRAILMGDPRRVRDPSLVPAGDPSWLASPRSIPAGSPEDDAARALGLHGEPVRIGPLQARSVTLAAHDPLLPVLGALGQDGLLAVPFVPRGEPWAVATPNAAARAFRDDDPTLDALVLGPYLVER